MILEVKFHCSESIPPTNVLVERKQRAIQLTLDLPKVYLWRGLLQANLDPKLGKITNDTA